MRAASGSTATRLMSGQLGARSDRRGSLESLRRDGTLLTVPAARLPITNETKLTPPICPTCRELLPPPAATGRPRTFCSPECRRQMFRLRQELVDLGGQLVDAQGKQASGFWPGTRFWGGQVRWLELAIEQIRERIPAEP
jgi:hypothetical protein